MFRKGKILENMIRDMRIWRDFDGKNVAELVQRYKVTYKTVYQAIKKNAKAGAWKISFCNYLRMSHEILSSYVFTRAYFALMRMKHAPLKR